MKLRLLISIVATAILFGSCSKKRPFNYDLNYTIAKVTCQASSNTLIADNTSELDLNVKIYVENGTYTDINSVQRTAYKEVPKERWRSHTIKFFLSDGTPVTPPFKTGSASASTLQFYATVDGIRSTRSVAAYLSEHPPLGSVVAPIAEQPEPSFFTVQVKAPLAVEAVRKMPVIFHVINSKINEDAYQRMDKGVFYDIVDQWNAVFTRKNDRSPNGGNPNIEFVPAIKDPSGKLLEEPGINRVVLTGEQVTAFEANALSYIWSNTSLLYWDCDKYLNVWISYNPSRLNTTEWVDYMKKCTPLVYPEGVWDNAGFPLPGDYQAAVKQLDATDLTAWKLNPGGPDKTGDLEQIGIVFANSGLAIKGNVNVVQPMGAFLGLIPNAPLLFSANYLLPPTGSAAKWYDDLCADSWRYDLWYAAPSNGGFETIGLGSPRTKYGNASGDPEIYNSSNIMEVSSTCSSITQEQTKRINWVLENAPGRQAWKNPWAITE